MSAPGRAGGWLPGQRLDTHRTIVVGAAIVRGDRVLAQRRARPRELAGRWELPGGRVEPGESETAALVRECHEELGVLVTVADRLGPDLPLSDRAVLRVYAAALAPGSPRPRALEHAGLRWLRPDELPTLDWLDADRALLPDLTAMLTRRSRT